MCSKSEQNAEAVLTAFTRDMIELSGAQYAGSLGADAGRLTALADKPKARSTAALTKMIMMLVQKSCSSSYDASRMSDTLYHRHISSPLKV
jgi:hypothetical protein